MNLSLLSLSMCVCQNYEYVEFYFKKIENAVWKILAILLLVHEPDPQILAIGTILGE